MILPIDLYRLNEEQALLTFCDKWNYRIVKQEILTNPVGGKYKHFEIDFVGIDGRKLLPDDVSTIKECFKEYELKHPGIWDMLEE
ncbi:MAG: hypothetical protein MR959_04400 [Selenomonas bovis]|nr:hypothetical protein [Selenomonas bovis]